MSASKTAVLTLALLLALLLALPLAHAIETPSTKPAPAVPAKPVKPGELQELDWEDLLPPKNRATFTTGAPAPVHDYLGEGGLAAQQVMDFNVNEALNGASVKIPGFIVPLDVGKDGTVTEFFLVPYFGACIHVPPPPPNQIVYVHAPKGIALDSIYEAYWVTGKLGAQQKSTRLGAAAYTLAAEKVEVYKY